MAQTHSSHQTTTTLPWVEKYRPEHLCDLVSNNAMMERLEALRQHRAIPNMIFYGPPGTGKTSTILAFAGHVNQHASDMILELNASDQRDLGTVRHIVHVFVSAKCLLNVGQRKLVILDEADALSKHAQAALTHLIDTYQRRVSFCFICNRISNLSVALQSRCAKFRFAPLYPKQMCKVLHRVIHEEKVAIEADAVKALLDIGHGDLRRCFNILQPANALQRVASSTTKTTPLTATQIYGHAGLPTPEQVDTLWRACHPDQWRFAQACQNVAHLLYKETLALKDMIRALHIHIPRQQQHYPKAQHNSMLCEFYKRLASIEQRLMEQDEQTELNIACLVSALRTIQQKDALRKTNSFKVPP